MIGFCSEWPPFDGITSPSLLAENLGMENVYTTSAPGNSGTNTLKHHSSTKLQFYENNDETPTGDPSKSLASSPCLRKVATWIDRNDLPLR